MTNYLCAYTHTRIEIGMGAEKFSAHSRIKKKTKKHLFAWSNFGKWVGPRTFQHQLIIIKFNIYTATWLDDSKSRIGLFTFYGKLNKNLKILKKTKSVTEFGWMNIDHVI